MPLTLITGPANSGKARALLAAVRAEAARGREPLLVLPTRADVEHYRRELTAGGVVFGVRVERFVALLGEIALRAGIGGRPLGAVARERVVAAVTASTRLRALSVAGATPGFPRALAALFGELSSQRVTPGRLGGALRAWADQDPGRGAYSHDLTALFAEYRRALSALGRDDAEGHATLALDALRKAPSRWQATPVLFYGFDDLTPLQLDVIESLGVVVDAPVTVTLAYEAGRSAFAGRATAFQTLLPLAATHHALAARAEHYQPGARAPLHHLERSLFEDGAQRTDPRSAVRLLEAGGERAELELVAGEIRALLDEGMVAGEIAVVVRAPSPGLALLGEVFRAHDVPHTLERRARFSDTAIGRGLVAALRCAAGTGTVHDLLAWLRTPGLLERPELADALEARCRAQGTVDLATARADWEARHWPLDALARLSAAGARGPAALISRAGDELARLFAAPRRRRAPLLTGEALEEARALAAGQRALAQLRELAIGAPALAPDAAALVEALAALELPAGEHSRPDAVAVVDPLALRARRVRALFLCGLQEGRFPAPASPEPFLADEERRELAERSGLRLARRDEGLGPERYLFYATVSRPVELLILSWHTADDEGVPTSPSLFLDDLCDLFDVRLVRDRRRRPLGAAGWPGPGRPTSRAAELDRILAGPRAAARPIAALRDEHVLTGLRERAVWSASGLESWAGCPVKWFVEHLLRAEDLEPEAEPLLRGGVAHAVLETTLEALLAQTGSARLTPASLPEARRLMAAAIEQQLADVSLSVAPERRAAARRRLEVDLDRYLAHAAREEGSLQPRYLEVEFGFEDSAHEALDLGDGVRVRGRIDRVDLDEAGRAVVYDYKGRNVAEPDRWVRDAHFQIALYMRAAEQLLGHRAAGGFYQPLGARDLRARGLLDADSGIELRYVNGDRREHAEFQALLDETVSAAFVSALQTRAGALEPRPDTCAWAGGCSYPSICRCDR